MTTKDLTTESTTAKDTTNVSTTANQTTTENVTTTTKATTKAVKIVKIKKAVKKAVPQAAKRYEDELIAEINQDREDHDKKPFDGPKPPEEKKIVSGLTSMAAAALFLASSKTFLASVPAS